MIHILALAFASSFSFVFLKAFQQLNVVRGQYLWVMPTSMAMAACEVYTVVAASQQGFGWVILPIGLGGGLGAMLAMYFHSRWSRKK